MLELERNAHCVVFQNDPEKGYHWNDSSRYLHAYSLTCLHTVYCYKHKGYGLMTRLRLGLVHSMNINSIIIYKTVLYLFVVMVWISNNLKKKPLSLTHPLVTFYLLNDSKNP